MINLKWLFAFSVFFVFNYGFSQSTFLKKDQITNDLTLLKSELLKNHPNIFTYSTEEEFDYFFEKTIEELPDSLSKLEVFKLVSSVSNFIKDGHAYVYPNAEYLKQFYSSAPLFPFDMFWDKMGFYIIRNLSEENNIPIGSKILAINNISIEEIHRTITQNMPRDGENLGYSNHLFYQFFPAYFSFFYGFQEEFFIEYEHRMEGRKMVNIKGLKRDELRRNRMSNKSQEKGIELTLDKKKQIAILEIKSFSNQILKTDYEQKFKREIKASFAKIEENNISKLVIDLRDNQGGELSNGVFLLQRILNRPFKCVEAYYKVKFDEKTGTREMKQIRNKWDDFFKPKKDHFKGEVYVFTNGGSFSCSAIVSNTFQLNNRGKIIGEMTGGSAYINSGGPNKELVLPKSKIQFTIPKTQYILQKDMTNIEFGVRPDYEINEDIDLIIRGRDSYYTLLLELIGRSN